MFERMYVHVCVGGVKKGNHSVNINNKIALIKKARPLSLAINQLCLVHIWHWDIILVTQ